MPLDQVTQCFNTGNGDANSAVTISLAASDKPPVFAAFLIPPYPYHCDLWYNGRSLNQPNPFTNQFALAALQTIWPMLPRAIVDGEDMEARQAMMLAAVWAGTAMDHSGLGLVHALSGPLTSQLHLHHGLANALLLPYVMRFNLPAIPSERRQALHELVGLSAGADDEALVERLLQFVHDLGLPTRLNDLDVSVDGVDWDTIAEETTRMVLIGNNPRPASAADCRAILDEMLLGYTR
jgi:alcohol dehydrogenase class IV